MASRSCTVAYPGMVLQGWVVSWGDARKLRRSAERGTGPDERERADPETVAVGFGQSLKGGGGLCNKAELVSQLAEIWAMC